MNRNTRVYLLACAIIIGLVAVGYGTVPGTLLPTILKVPVNTVDARQVFRATMGLYLAMAGLWFTGAFNSKLQRPALISAVLFMAGLGFGRLLSVLLDGLPSPVFTIGMLLEFGLAVWGVWLWLNTHAKQESQK